MVEERWSTRCGFRRWSGEGGLVGPLVDALNVAVVHADAELEEQHSNFMHGHSKKFDQPCVEQLGAEYSLLERAKHLPAC